jgi:tripartite-type tricarboxylate transporter receptor subunit TctC
MESFEKALGSTVYDFQVEEYAPLIALMKKAGLDKSWNGPAQIAKQLEASAKQIRDAVKEFGAGVVK